MTQPITLINVNHHKQKPFHVPECEYCAGYYISKELINNIIDNISVFNDIIEDCAVGSNE
jgi:hypothetical protein